jgi:hypothetical protein
MNCENLTNYISQSDFDCVGLVAAHCDLKKLCIATEESKTFDLIPLFCFDFVQDVLNNWNLESSNENYAKYQALIFGGNYTDVNGKNYQNLGFKKVWIYYAYARYILINQINDTANGTVRKQNEWSVSTPLKEVTDISNKYRNMGKAAFESLTEFLCENKSDYTKFDDCNCRKRCGCSGICTCGKTKKMTGIKFSTISR